MSKLLSVVSFLLSTATASLGQASSVDCRNLFSGVRESLVLQRFVVERTSEHDFFEDFPRMSEVDRSALLSHAKFMGPGESFLENGFVGKLGTIIRFSEEEVASMTSVGRTLLHLYLHEFETTVSTANKFVSITPPASSRRFPLVVRAESLRELRLALLVEVGQMKAFDE